MCVLDIERFRELSRRTSPEDSKFLDDFPQLRLRFAYDHISDPDIARALDEMNGLDLIHELASPWEGDGKSQSASLDTLSLFHARRVAIFVSALRKGIVFPPVQMDTMSSCFGWIVDGHHRIRAFEFLGVFHVPAEVSGYVKVIDELECVGILR